jgi:hypothetical protein
LGQLGGVGSRGQNLAQARAIGKGEGLANDILDLGRGKAVALFGTGLSHLDFSPLK